MATKANIEMMLKRNKENISDNWTLTAVTVDEQAPIWAIKDDVI
jgi:hypothetical protein